MRSTGATRDGGCGVTRDQKERDFSGHTRSGAPAVLAEIRLKRDFRSTHEVKGLVGSRETSRMCDCGRARPEALPGDTKGRIHWAHWSSGGSGPREIQRA